MTTKREWLAIGAILLATLGYHVVTIDRQSLFVDEFCELSIAREPIDELLFKADSMPPLYPLALRGWLTVWQTDAAARWLSALFGAASVVVLWRTVRTLTTPAIGVAAAASLAICPLHLYYSQFVRAYALVELLAVAAIGCFALAARGRPRRWPAFVALSVVGMFTHYYFAILLASLGLISLVALRGRIGWRQLAAFVAIGVLASPVVVFLKEDFGFQKNLRESRPLSVAAFGYTYASFFSGYTLGPSKPELQTLASRDAAMMILPWLGAIAVGAGPLAVAGYRRLREFGLGAAVLAMAVVPVLMTGALGAIAGITYNVRFVAWCAAPLAVLLAAGAMAPGWTRVTRGAAVVVALVCIAALVNRHANPRYYNEDLRQAAQIVSAEAAPGAVVFCSSDYLTETLQYYLDRVEGDHRAVALPVENEINQPIDNDAIAAECAGRVAQESGAWVVYSRAFHGDHEGLLKKALDRLPGVAATDHRVPGVVLYSSAGSGRQSSAPAAVASRR